MYDHPSPVFLDFETQSACDLPEEGSWRYADHPSTRILILVVNIHGQYHVWLPSHVGVDCTRWHNHRMWPNELLPAKPISFYSSKTCPDIILHSVLTNPIVSHNAYGFDKLIWDRCIGAPVAGWLDSMYLSRAAGLPGSLEALSKAKLGKGKDHAKSLLKALTTARGSLLGRSFVYPSLPLGDIQAFTRYAIADVELITRLWPMFDDLEVEADVIDTHNRINERGIKLDIPLLQKIEDVSAYSVKMAGKEIEQMTGGVLHENNIRSTKQVHEWLSTYDITITDDKGKKCLRKEIVQRFIDSPYLIEEHLTAAREVPPVVIDVLKLRMRALRITDAKVKRAQLRVSHDGRARGLLAYHAAHTGRKSSYGIQIHNLPRPVKGLDVEEILKLYENDKGNDPASLFAKIKEAIKDIPITVDDVSSGMIRPSLMADEGKILGIVDYSQVEARCVAWMADQEDLLTIFRRDGDVYSEMAARLYNIPLNQVTKEMRQVGKIVILGCGYGMGVHKFRIFCANAGVDLVKAGITADQCIEGYRNTYPKIAGWKPHRDKSYRVGGLWKDIDKATFDTVSMGSTCYAGKCEFLRVGRELRIRLPSGRCIRYPNARIEDVVPPYVYTMGLPEVPKATVVYDSPRGVKSLYGGLTTENISQGICRDFMVEAEVKLERNGLTDIVLDVHDEILNEFAKSKAHTELEKMVRIMGECPAWAPGFPLSCKGFLSPRFVKEAFKGYKEVSSLELSNRGIAR